MKYTQLNVLNHNRRQRIQSQPMTKWSDITSVADRKSNLLQYHENTRVITGAKFVIMHLVTYIYIKFGRKNEVKVS